MKSSNLSSLTRALLGLALAAGLASPLTAEPLKIAYNDWPGWVPWEIAIKKGWFEEAGVEVEFMWIDYVESFDAYASGTIDGVHMTNGDALVIGATAKPAVGILINDFSNGNDMFVAAPGITSVADMKGKKVALEEGFVTHLLMLQAVEATDGIEESDIEVVNTPNGETPQVLRSGAVDAICAWQPNSGQALKLVDGSSTIFSSADAPGLIYDCLFVDPESLQANRDEWKKVIKVWYKIVDFLKDEDNLDDALAIMSARVELTPDEYEPLLGGTYILTLEEALQRWKDADGLGSVYGSSRISNDFNMKYGAYGEDGQLQVIEKYFDPSLILEVAEEME